MKKLILTMIFCLFAVNVSAGQQEDMDLCAQKIKKQYKVDVIKKWFDINENCKTNERYLVFSDDKELYDCQLNRKKNYIYVINRKWAGEIATKMTKDYQYMIDAMFPEKLPKGRCGLINENYLQNEYNVINKKQFQKQQKLISDKQKKETVEACYKALEKADQDDIVFYDFDDITYDKENPAYLNIGEQPTTFFWLFEIGRFKILCYRGSDEYNPKDNKKYKNVSVWFTNKSGLTELTKFKRTSYKYQW
ncbi:unknown [Acetobacter sp. CAG:267]|nr:unknown [Acetobacter sp. CAG:267]